jgi:hypothetical protein
MHWEISLEKFLDDERDYLSEAFRQSGAPGNWAADMSTATARLLDLGIKAFALGSSIGIHGWVLANRKEVREGKC